MLDATGLVVAPGFINVLSHAWGSLQLDRSGASDLLQGVTTEVFGEAFSLGPSDGRLAEAMRPWGGLGEDARVDFDRLSPGPRPPRGARRRAQRRELHRRDEPARARRRVRRPAAEPAELDRLRALVDEEMADGALGIGTALIYPPGRFARTDELIALCEVVGRHGGTYISHMRSEGDQFLECLDELLTIGRDARCRAEVYHLKAAGQPTGPR